ncbi:hypothetical protein RBY4I_1971 [Rhodobacterales bacterium Y4I]|nr:hypothetical protein RBY4I_1971 [Rhodobacterales bacterium Y4I]
MQYPGNLRSGLRDKPPLRRSQAATPRAAAEGAAEKHPKMLRKFRVAKTRL